MKSNVLIAWGMLLILLSPLLNAQLVEVQESWVARYDNGSGEFLNDMTVDASGNIYVTGYSYDAATDDDILTIKYDPSGNVLWLNRYNNNDENGRDQGSAIEVDASGNVYVTGNSKGTANGDFFTIAYDADGNELWTARYDGTGTNGDNGLDLTTDNSGNVYVAGLVADAVNDRNYLTIKYDASGAQQWAAIYDGPNEYDIATDVAVDEDGNVYVTGSSSSQNGDQDAATIKYNSSGVEQWVKRYDGSGSDFPTDMEIDAGYVYITGETNVVSSDRDFFTTKYDASTGNEEWTSLYNGTLNSWDSPFDLVLDGSGNVIVAGQSAESTALDFAVVKYNSSGVMQWVRTYDYNGTDDIARSLAVDASGNIYVTGEVDNGSSSFDDKDIFTIRYNPSGVLMWTASYDGPAGEADIYSIVNVDGSGNVIVSGNSEGIGTSFDYVTIKYQQVTSVTGGIEELIQDVQNLPLSKGNKNSLISKLQNALKKYNSGDLATTINVLSAFLNQLNDFVDMGYLTAEQIQPLVDKTNLILDELNSMLPKMSSLQVPEEFTLSQNYPNPFNPSTKISYQVPFAGNVEISIFNSLGEKVVDLLNEQKQAGYYEVEWNASNLPSGIYFYRMKAGEFSGIQKMILMK